MTQEKRYMTKARRDILIRNLLIAGERCANVCFNLGQESVGNIRLEDRHKSSMRTAQEEWDKASQAWAEAQQK